MTSNRRPISFLSFSIMACLFTASSFTSTGIAFGQAAAAPAAPAAGSTAPADPAAAAAPAAAPSLTISAPAAAAGFKFAEGKKYSVSGILDGYYNYDSDSPNPGNTQLRNFDIRANQVSLTEAKVVLAYDPAPIGVRVDFGLGSVFQTMHPSNPSGTGLKYVEQMYVSAKPAKLKGFQLDFGQFVTSAGAEVIESGDNWDYSRSLLFALAIPYYHMGFRASMPITSSLTAGVQVVQGWNNIFDNNSGKTVGITAVEAKKYYTWSGNYYVGPENNNTDIGYRNLIDSTLLLTPTAKFNAYINYDYGQNRNANAKLTAVGSLAHWQGIAVAAHGQLTSKLTATGRFEYFADLNGFQTGTVQKLNEYTFTADYLLHPGILVRSEFREDYSNQNYFQKGKTGATNAQPTFEIALIGFFGSKT